MLTVARERACLTVCAAVILPLAFLIIQRATIYNGIRHVLFVIPMLAVIAGVLNIMVIYDALAGPVGDLHWGHGDGLVLRGLSELLRP